MILSIIGYSSYKQMKEEMEELVVPDVVGEISNNEHCVYEYLPNRKFAIEYGLKIPGVALVRNG